MVHMWSGSWARSGRELVGGVLVSLAWVGVLCMYKCMMAVARSREVPEGVFWSW